MQRDLGLDNLPPAIDAESSPPTPTWKEFLDFANELIDEYPSKHKSDDYIFIHESQLKDFVNYYQKQSSK